MGLLGYTKFHDNRPRGWERGPLKVENFHFLIKSRPARFLQFLGASMRPTTLRKCFKFDMIRFTDYEVIAEKPRVGYLPRIFPCTL